MRETVNLTGMVLKTGQVGDHDKRLVILTRERGKITAFARGVRRPGNQMMAASSPFVFGQFRLMEGRDAYNLFSVEVSNYFQELTMDVEAACYASYFMEMADYYGRENMESSELILLLYQSLRALMKPALSRVLVRRICELRMMVIFGEYREQPPFDCCDSTRYTWEYVISSPIEKLYSFTVTDQVLEEFEKGVDENMRRVIDRPFHSLEILKAMI